MRGARILMMLGLVVSPLTLGCGPGVEPEDVAKQRTGLSALAIAYGQYTSSNRGRPPRSEEALRKFIDKMGPEFLDSLNVEHLDDMFISPRDNEPYVVIYGKGSQVVAYEAVGVDGKRFIAHDLGGVEEVDEATFAKMVPDAK